jgi:hypothetical protein
MKGSGPLRRIFLASISQAANAPFVSVSPGVGDRLGRPRCWISAHGLMSSRFLVDRLETEIFGPHEPWSWRFRRLNGAFRFASSIVLSGNRQRGGCSNPTKHVARRRIEQGEMLLTRRINSKQWLQGDGLDDRFVLWSRSHCSN